MSNFVSDLALNLISEAVGILVTVLVIDRLLAVREGRRWREVRELFLAYAGRASASIINAWQNWLVATAAEVPLRKLSKEERSMLSMAGYQAPEGKQFTKLVETYLGEPAGSKLTQLASGSDAEIDEMIQVLVPYLAKSVSAQTHSGWTRLREELGPPAQRLSELVDKYSTLVDPEFAKSVIRLSIDLDNLESGAYEKTTEERSEDLAKAMVIAEAIRYSLQLGSYIRRERKAS